MRLIDADELKEWIEAWFDMNKYYHPYSKRKTIPTEELFDILDRIPTVDPVKHGRWVGISDSDATPRCSNCGRTRFGSSLGYAMKYVPYCEKCGAKMDEVAQVE